MEEGWVETFLTCLSLAFRTFLGVARFPQATLRGAFVVVPDSPASGSLWQQLRWCAASLTLEGRGTLVNSHSCVFFCVVSGIPFFLQTSQRRLLCLLSCVKVLCVLFLCVAPCFISPTDGGTLEFVSSCSGGARLQQFLSNLMRGNTYLDCGVCIIVFPDIYHRYGFLKGSRKRQSWGLLYHRCSTRLYDPSIIF